MWKKYRHIFLTILFVKLVTGIIIIFAYYLLPFASTIYASNFVYPLHSPITLQTAFQTWDAQHYLYISKVGYKIGNDSNAFPPLFPFTIYLFTFLTRNNFWSGIILSNVFSFIGFFLFYRLVKNIYTEKISYQSLLILLAFPTSFYFSLIYTESLFFLLVMIFFLALQKRKLVLASIAALLLPMTRIIGVAIVVPFIFSYVLEYRGKSLYDEVLVICKVLWSKKSLLICSPFVGLFITMLIFYISTGNFFAQFLAQQNFIAHFSFFSIVNPIFFIHALLTFPLRIHGFTDSLLDRLFFIGFICLVPFLLKRVSTVFFIYTIVFGLTSVLSGSFMSYMRFLVVIFPIFICLGKMFQEKKYEKFAFPFLYLSLLLQALFIIMHSLNYWVA